MNINFLKFLRKISLIFKSFGILSIFFFIPYIFFYNQKIIFALSNPVASQTKNIIYFKDENEKTSYSLGVSLGSYIEHSLLEQKQLGVFLDKQKLLLGIQDKIEGILQLSKQEITDKLKNLESKLKSAELSVLKKYNDENYIKGESYLSEFIKKNHAQKTDTGLVFLIQNTGDGKYPTDNDMIAVNYIGFLTDGSEFDNSYTKGEPIWLSMKDLIPGWKEGIKYIKKGGRIKLIIPPHLAYGTNGVPGIPGNATLIFDVELADIKSL